MTATLPLSPFLEVETRGGKEDLRRGRSCLVVASIEFIFVNLIRTKDVVAYYRLLDPWYKSANIYINIQSDEDYKVTILNLESFSTSYTKKITSLSMETEFST
jgi:hypothetical protein